MWVALTGAVLGIAAGVRHAMEPDHLAAVSTLVAEQRSPRATVTFAAVWGMGHALMLVLVGGALLFVGRAMPPALADVFELGVAIMLVGLGVRGLMAAVRARHGEKARGEREHHGHAHMGRPLAVGLMHGLAGSGALTALVVSQVGSPLAGLGYMALYGIGATLGMAMLASVFGLPLARVVRSPYGMPILMGLTGAISLVVGAFWGAPLAMRMLG